MASIAEVGVKLVAHTQAFERGMMRAGKTLRGFRNAALAAAGAGSLWQAGSRFLATGQAIDRIGKLSTRLGETTEELSKLRFLAKTSGVEFEVMAKGMADGARKLSEAAGGKGEAKDAFAKLGLSAKELAKLSPAQQLREIADAFKLMDDNSLELELVQRIYGESGAQMLQFLNQGAEGIDKNTEAAKRLGAELSVAGTRNVELFHDRVAALGTSIASFFEKSYAGLTAMANRAVDSIKDARAQISEHGAGVLGVEVIAADEKKLSGVFKFAEEVHQRNVKARQEEEKRRGIASDLRAIYDDIFKKQQSAPTSTGQFGAVNLANVALSNRASISSSKPQMVKDPGIDVVVDVLRQILAKSGSARAA